MLTFSSGAANQAFARSTVFQSGEVCFLIFLNWAIATCECVCVCFCVKMNKLLKTTQIVVCRYVLMCVCMYACMYVSVQQNTAKNKIPKKKLLFQQKIKHKKQTYQRLPHTHSLQQLPKLSWRHFWILFRSKIEQRECSFFTQHVQDIFGHFGGQEVDTVCLLYVVTNSVCFLLCVCVRLCVGCGGGVCVFCCCLLTHTHTHTLTHTHT